MIYIKGTIVSIINPTHQPELISHGKEHTMSKNTRQEIKDSYHLIK